MWDIKKYLQTVKNGGTNASTVFVELKSTIYFYM
jgi:hypothetical protein